MSGTAAGSTGRAADVTPGLGDDPDLRAIEEALSTIVRQAKSPRQQERIARIGAVSLEASMYPILRHTETGGPLRLSDLADAIGVDLSTLSRQVRDLQVRGLVRRKADPADGRAALLELTESGRRVLGEFRAARRRRVAELVEGWSKEDRAQLARLLERLARAIVETVEP